MSQNEKSRRTAAAFWVSLLLVIVASWVVLQNNIRTAPFHGDESGWIASGYYYTDLLLERDFTWEKWDCPTCGAWGSLNLHLGKLLIGLPLKMYSETQLDGQEFTQYYEPSQPLKVNQAEGRVPRGDMWLFARRMSIVFGSLTCVVAFTIGFRVADFLAGWIFVGLLLTNQTFIGSATRAMTDVHYNFFLLCFLLAATWFMARPRASRWSIVACGLCAGLACSVKVTGIAIAGLAFCGLIAYGLLLRRFRIKTAIVYLALFSLVAVGVVYLLNPNLWPSFSNIQTGAVWQEILQLGANLGSGGLPSREALAADYPQIEQLARPFGFPLMFPRWGELMSSQIRIGLWKTDNRFLELHQSLARWLTNDSLLWLLLPAGILYSTAKVWSAFREKQTSPLVVPLPYFLVNYLVILVFLKLNWDRYYVPTVVAGTLIIAIALSAAVRQAIPWGKQVLAGVSSQLGRNTKTHR